MTTLLWILVLVVAPLGMGVVLLYDRGVRSVMGSMKIVAEQQGVDAKAFLVWLDKERLRTPLAQRVVSTLLPGVMSLFMSPERVAEYAKGSEAAETLFDRYRAMTGENVRAGEHKLDPLGDPSPLLHEIVDTALNGDLQALMIFTVDADGAGEYTAYLSSKGDKHPMSPEGYKELRRMAEKILATLPEIEKRASATAQK